MRGIPSAIPLGDHLQAPSGACPPFQLRDHTGSVIDPVHGVNATSPYSPRQTCGAAGCHDYDKITEGFHFTQGRGEEQPESWKARFAWTLYPGNYGGNWCSPAPLYRALAPKHNENARDIDMTSFDFITAGCGGCHPGGGSLETDRDGHRYDLRMADPASGLASGAENGLDGDYYKARWSETGVIEADCLLCHQPEYDYKGRNAPLARHDWLPPLHMQEIACQTCHIPNRAAKSAMVQASDVYNPAPRITPPPGAGASPDTVYPELAKVQDDDNDGMPEVNRPEEIDALLTATRKHLEASGFPLQGRTLVWVSDGTAWRSSTESRQIPMEEWEASPYASVFKFSHDVSPARAALGSGGCTDCHASKADFFDRPVLASAFGADGKPVWTPNAEILGLSPTLVLLGAFREGTLKPVLYALLALVGALLGGLGARSWTVRVMSWTAARGRLLGFGLVGAVLIGGLVVLAEPGLLSYMTLSRFALDAAHFLVAMVILGIGALSSTVPLSGTPGRWLPGAGLVMLALAALCGAFMLLKLEPLETLVRLSYTGFDLALALSLVVSALQILSRLSRR